MAQILKPIVLLLAALSASGAVAARADALAAQAQAAAHPAGPVAAADIEMAAQRYQKRALLVFADSPDNPDFQRQLALLTAGLDDLASRDVVVITDSDPAALSEWRRHIRPRGFSLVQLDKDFTPVFRKPLPWSVREINRSIDKLESRRQEVLERFPGR